jgi:hypothetical protein
MRRKGNMGESIDVPIGSLLELFAPISIASDKSLMLQACQFDSVLRSVDVTLTQDRSFLSAALQQHPQQLMYLDIESQLRFPELVISCLKPFYELNLPSHASKSLLMVSTNRSGMFHQTACYGLHWDSLIRMSFKVELIFWKMSATTMKK